ncbi:MAG: sugar ABC transporter substrate-binding protein [Oscillatoriales cyanobacterium]|uniref:Sugar ABC transporter substrate-binding protein n=1 Tax=Microcoleus anatoxicus PTRS2 TaxID=2705321 RepID=A0ABU8YPB1_9CYAN|nr:MAG: sugar ABC transporter substrate-binding protein [Oscillatoriales cyanobacterium]TAE03622.1 MAG: sugar ABC transporter substrate-binding protein [Oscillatoriales cyanobacterium]TAF36690.1 MAG: sugar ABC transporter substrate-binding protein [Oscillatoriales cyanobacterium]
MKRKSWQLFTIFGLVGLLLSALVSCGKPAVNSPTKNSATLEFWTMQLQPQFTEYFNQTIANFEKENPTVKVRWVDVPWSAMESKILGAVSAKTAPDVVNLNPDFASLLAGRNAWLDLDSRISDQVRSTYLPNIWKSGVLDGKSFGIPWYLTTGVTIYNTDLLKKAGIAKPPTTYTELAQVAKQVKQKTGKFAFFVTFVPEDSAEVLQSLVQMGVTLVDAQGKAAFNNDKGKAAFEYWVDLYKGGFLPQDVLVQGHRRAIELYQSGDTALLASGPQFLKAIAENAPSIGAVSAVAPQITGPNGKKTVAVMNLVVPRDSKRPDDAVKFALFLTNSQNQLAFAKAANVLPSNLDALKDSYFKSVPADAPTADKARIVSASGLEKAELLIPPLKDVKKLQKAIYDNLQAAMLGEKSVELAVADAATAWDQR